MSLEPDEAWATYHVMREDDGTASLLVRLRHQGAALYGEVFVPGDGWVEDARAFDVLRNGQDYDLIDESEAERLAARMPVDPSDS
jgi:hypothetical protein